MLLASNVHTDLSKCTADLLFSLFIYVTDADEGLTAREVQCLNTMCDDTTWAKSSFLVSGLDSLRSQYKNIWIDYQKKIITRDLKSILQQLNLVATDPNAPNASDLVAALRHFLDRLFQSSASAWVRLGIKADSPAKTKARAEIFELFAQPINELIASSNAKVISNPGIDAGNSSKNENLLTTAEAHRADTSIWPAASISHSPESIWKRGKTSVHCIAVIQETHDVKTFVFQAVRPILFFYKPGQFVTLDLPIDGKTVRRSYTLSSSPTRPLAISITVKRVPNGVVSNWLHDNMHVGFQFKLSGPHGEFTCFHAPAEKLLLISAGSGITPIMSMLRWIVDANAVADVVFINNIRTPSDIIFERELSYLASRMGEKLRIEIIPSHVDPKIKWDGLTSRFRASILKLLAPDFQEREIFVCGPSGYMEFVRTTLEATGYQMYRYHEESFGDSHTTKPHAESVGGKLRTATNSDTKQHSVQTPVPAKIDSPLIQTPSTEKVEIFFAKSSKTVIASIDDYILDLADEHGIALDSSCEYGQ